MIRLHRLAHTAEPFDLNPDLVVTVEASPDTHVTLSTGTRLLVAETPDEVVAAIRGWRVGVLADALALGAGRSTLNFEREGPITVG